VAIIEGQGGGKLRFLRLGPVRERVSLSTTRIYELIAEGKFPAPIRLSDRASAWIETEVVAWMEGRISATREQPRAERPKIGPTTATGGAA
jgi:prophage regulatory protein